MEEIAAAKRIAIIGAGSSGLTSIKCCLEEGLVPVCFEMSDDIGGLWNFTEHTPGQEDRLNASVYKSCSINTSKEMMAFSDFPIPVNFPPFMPHHKVLEYFRMYASHFNLLKLITFNTKVVCVEQTDDHIETGRWEVTTKNLKSGTETTEVYDGVMVCSGHHRFPHKPAIEGMSRYKGKVMHSSEYKTQSVFEDKKVLVMGMYAHHIIVKLLILVIYAFPTSFRMNHHLPLCICSVKVLMPEILSIHTANRPPLIIDLVIYLWSL